MERGRRKRAWITGLAIAIMLYGCGNNNGMGEKRTKTTYAETTEYHFLEEGNETEAEDATGKNTLVWIDNYLDDYHAVINHPVKKIEEEGEIPLGGALFIGEGGCARHGKHRFNNYKKNWDGVNGITADGKEFEARIEAAPDREGTQISSLGPVSGKIGYAACYYDYKNGAPSEYWFYELDGGFKVIRSVKVNCESRGEVQYLAGDANGSFHVLFRGTGLSMNYVVVSSEGVLLFEKEVGILSELCAFGGGRIAIRERTTEANENKFCELKTDSGEYVELPLSKEKTVRGKMQEGFYAATLLDDQRIAWCDEVGISVFDSGSGMTNVAYRWANHGLTSVNASRLTVMTDGSFAILYNDGGATCYLLLRPTETKEELKSITLAASPDNKEEYEKASAFFKKKYPAYVINVKYDWDETSLLTQLGAGTGPVLVDTSLTGFEELEKLWQPLDGFLEQTHLAEEMIPKTLEFGKIGNVTYGIVRDFRIETLIALDFVPADWNYEEYLNTLENFGGVAFSAEGLSTPADFRKELFDVWENGLSDNYYFNAETGEMIFGTSEFERVTRLVQKAGKCLPAENGQAIREGRALCERTDVVVFAQAIKLRRRVEANGERVIGYPTGEGARHLLVARAPLALRSTATEEEKEIAYTFLKVYLSKEATLASRSPYCQVRKDAMEKQFLDYQKTVEADIEYGRYNPAVMPELDWDKDVNFLYELIENGTVEKAFPTGLKRVFDEEVGEYLDGRIDAAALSDHLQNRFWLYLEEQK